MTGHFSRKLSFSWILEARWSFEMWPLSLSASRPSSGICAKFPTCTQLHILKSPKWVALEFQASVASQNLLGNALARKQAHNALQVQLCSFCFPDIA